MLANVATFMAPKRGAPSEECEDALWVSPNCEGEFEGASLRVVVSDGASESLQAGRWARRLSSTFGSGAASPVRTRAAFLSAYRAAVGGWEQEITEYAAERESRNAPIQWFEDRGLQTGSHATIVAVEFLDARGTRGPTWRGGAVGDSCVFQVRDERLYASFPIVDADAFTSRPPLLASRGARDEVVVRHINACSGDWEHGDSFYVVTDALAAWFLRSVGDGKRPWAPLRDLTSLDFDLDFDAWVNDQRDTGDMHNDDTTLVRVDFY